MHTLAAFLCTMASVPAKPEREILNESKTHIAFMLARRSESVRNVETHILILVGHELQCSFWN